ncbi:MAG TPA: PilZ domain-containing protein [Solirubrobacteraceae bacterium]|nr:PilZ domain-containing protein [Solirubrobacteraceae bacterium]
MTGERLGGPSTPRAQIAVSCTLRRRRGSPLVVETLDLGPSGMRVTSARPLAEDETVEVELDLPGLGIRVAAQARVLRQQRPDVYGLRFERLPEPISGCLHALALDAR